MADFISKDKVFEILNGLGGCDAFDEYSTGWDEAIEAVGETIEAAYNVGNLPVVEPFTKAELCIISLGLGTLAASTGLKNINFSSIMKKISRMAGSKND